MSNRLFALTLLLLACERPAHREAVASGASALPSTVTAPSAPPSTAPSASVADSGASEVRAWFSVAAKPKCDPGSPPYGACYVVTLSLHGAVERELVVAKNQWGQEYCRAARGASVACGGASGTTSIDVRCAASGACIVEKVDESDGYCPPPEDCSSKTKLLSFAVPAGSKVALGRK